MTCHDNDPRVNAIEPQLTVSLEALHPLIEPHPADLAMSLEDVETHQLRAIGDVAAPVVLHPLNEPKRPALEAPVGLASALDDIPPLPVLVPKRDIEDAQPVLAKARKAEVQ